MKIKPEYENEMIDKMINDLDDALLLIQNVDISCSLSNHKEIMEFSNLYAENKDLTLDKAYFILCNLHSILIKIKNKENNESQIKPV